MSNQQDYDKNSKNDQKKRPKWDRDSISNVGNPIINIYTNSKHKEKDHEKKECCECSGMLNAGVNFVNICPKCSKDDVSVVKVGDFTSTFVNEPTCISTGEDKYLFAGGYGIFQSNTGKLQGVFSIILAERPGASDEFAFSFSGFGAGGVIALTSRTTVPDNTLMIKQCKSNDCKCSSSDQEFLPLMANVIENRNTDTTGYQYGFQLHPDGTVEEIDETI